MSLRSKFLRGGMILSAGQVFSQGLSVLRNILVARMIVTDADFGIASTLIMVVAFNEMLTNLGMHTLVVQDRDGDLAEFLNTAHFVAFIRGIVGATSLLVISYPLALVFGIPQSAWAFAVLAVIPLLRGLLHFDIHRLQRHHLFLPVVLQETLGQAIALAACVPFLRLFGDYSAVLYLLIFQTAAMTALSHLLAKTPYRWSRDHAAERRIMAFGVPLLLNGVAFFVISQGERIAIGSSGQLFAAASYSMEDMAALSVALMIASLAPMFLTRILSSLFVPLLSRVEDDRLMTRSAICTQAHAFGGGIVAIPLVLFGNGIVEFVFGHRYTTAGTIVVFASCSQALLALRCGASVTLMSRGLTWDAFANTLWRSAAFPISLAAASTGCPVAWIAIPAIAGELLAIVVLARQLRSRCAIPLVETFLPLAIVVSGLGAACTLRLFAHAQMPRLIYVAVGFIAWCGFVSAWAMFFPETHRLIRSVLRRVTCRPAYQGSA